MIKTEEKKYKAAMYVRLSKEDDDKEGDNKKESDSITNQKILIDNYVKENEDIEIVSVRVDDGYSGVTFENRPAFNAMIADVKSGNVNCVIVKDLSRFSRNYIDAGNYIEKIFPYLNVRFIAINDGIDTVNNRDSSNNIIIPFKNFINDSYSRDISMKIRSGFESKRKRGDFISAFTPYGYLKNPSNKNKLIVDEFSAIIVKDIFKWKIEGYSQNKIAEKLNEKDVLSPAEYKKSIGLKYTTVFQTNAKSKWSAKTISRILKNKVYIGTLEQGKSTTPNHKIKKVQLKKESEWIVIENNHEPIINEIEFYNVNDLLKKYTRTAPNEESVHLFSGMLICSDCGVNLVRKIVPSNKKKYIYYVCATNKYEKTCSSHAISDKALKKSVILSIENHIDKIIDLEKIMKYIDELPYKEYEVKKIELQIIKSEERIDKYSKLKLGLYEDLKEEIITKEEYYEHKIVFETNIIEANNGINVLNKEKENIINSLDGKSEWINSFKQYKAVKSLNRTMIVTLIEKIIVHEGNRIEIFFRYQDEYLNIVEFVENSIGNKEKNSKEVI